jgi:predicted Zn-dependent protease
MKRTWVKVICIALALTLCGAGVVFAAKKAEKEIDVSKALIDSYELLSKQKYAQAQKLLDQVLAKDPGNPLALNNMASVMVGMKKFDKADTYLNQALPKAKGYMVQVNRVCTVGNICMAFKPVSGGAGNQDLEPLIKMNIEMVKGYMTAGPLPGSGLR